MLNKMNLNLLRSLYVLLEERHVSRTAERLHITQSAVSRQLSQLREWFDDPLLVRDGNQLIPTPRAEQLSLKLVDLFSEFETLIDDKPFEPLEWDDQFVMASSDYVAQYILPEIAQLFATQAPKVNLHYQLWLPEYLNQLAEGSIQLASTMLPEKPAGVSSVQIGEDRSVCVMRKGHPLDRNTALSVEEMLAYSHIRVSGGGDKDSYIDKALKDIGRARNIALTVPFFSAAFNSLCRSDYLMVIPFHIAHNLSQHIELSYLPLPVETPTHKYWLLWHSKYDQDPAHQWGREMIKSVLDKSEYSIGYVLKS
ncbi:LysR family transcriptional regulator [Vibrio genomosp. F6]|uniref:LysR family transcriptional regulator n=1 Tax=Vibrio genomosp. F6 TaxID=723172 RepID=UPI0010BD5B79|nr:LysR family transcriptional regulator [Vibrio genomosp. F6]TKF16512.1 LysR family transcriptional regulator [Vibrio genomosp. F6]